MTAITTVCARCGEDTTHGVCSCTREWDQPRCRWCGATRPACPDWVGHDRLDRESELTWWAAANRPSALRGAR